MEVSCVLADKLMLLLHRILIVILLNGLQSNVYLIN